MQVCQDNGADLWKKKLQVRSVTSSSMRNDILKYHMEQGKEKQCYRNSLMQNQIFRTLQQHMKRKYIESKIFFHLADTL